MQIAQEWYLSYLIQVGTLNCTGTVYNSHLMCGSYIISNFNLKLHAISFLSHKSLQAGLMETYIPQLVKRLGYCLFQHQFVQQLILKAITLKIANLSMLILLMSKGQSMLSYLSIPLQKKPFSRG